ncbi:MAG: ABC transporter permease [Clostridiales bacterium]|nr:ABC transporter permease [Clostridiales bacterium]
MMTEQVIEKKPQTNSKKILRFVIDNSVTLLFVVICIFGIIASKEQPFILVSMLLERMTRNTFLVLALLIPVVAGMGLNFSITIGAMAAQIAIITVAYLKIPSVGGLAVAFVISTPIALILGKYIGKLLNRTRGQEMIASMITGFFADGIYQMIFLFMCGTIIPMAGGFILSSGMGLRNTIDLMKDNGIGKSLDNIVSVPFFYVTIVAGLVVVAYYIWKMKKESPEGFKKNKMIAYIGIGALLTVFSILVMFTKVLPHKYALLKTVNMSVFTALVVGGFAVFNVILLNTKLGQTLKTVGQDKHIAEVSGIKVNKIRELAIMLSTVFAAWGQIIFIQNLGILNTYGSHKQIALFAVAALLIGGASVSKATIGQAFLGVLLFHTLFIVSPKAGLNLFGDAQLGEYFRTFVAYGVIGVSLGLHAWKTLIMKRNE